MQQRDTASPLECAFCKDFVFAGTCVGEVRAVSYTHLGGGLSPITKQFHRLGGKYSGLYRLSHGVGCKEKSLIEQTIVSQSRAAFSADSRRSEAHRGRLHQIAASGDVSPGGRKTAPRVFDEGPHDQKMCIRDRPGARPTLGSRIRGPGTTQRRRANKCFLTRRNYSIQ